jgi:hypothetical protein
MIPKKLQDWAFQNAPENGGYARNPEDEVNIQEIA